MSARDPRTPPPARLDDAGDLLFTAVRQRPDDVAAHHTFLTYCADKGLLPEAARAYRDLLARRDRAAVEAQAILRMTQEAQRERQAATSRWGGTLTVLLVLAVLALALPLVLALCRPAPLPPMQ